MNATLSPITDFGTDEAFDVSVNLGRSQHACLTRLNPLPGATSRRASRAWPTAVGFIYVVDTYPGLAALAKTLLEMEGFSVCAFEDRSEAWRAFAFAYPRPAVLITDNLDGNTAALDLIRRCRSLEPGLKTLLVDHQISIATKATETELFNGRLPLPYCGPLLAEEVRRVCARVGSTWTTARQVQP